MNVIRTFLIPFIIFTSLLEGVAVLTNGVFTCLGGMQVYVTALKLVVAMLVIVVVLVMMHLLCGRQECSQNYN